MRRRTLRAEVARLTADQRRLVAALGRSEAQTLYAQRVAADALDELDLARDEIRRIRSEHGTTANRAMPEGDAA
jgi:hypothetical protein